MKGEQKGQESSAPEHSKGSQGISQVECVSQGKLFQGREAKGTLRPLPTQETGGDDAAAGREGPQCRCVRQGLQGNSQLYICVYL